MSIVPSSKRSLLTWFAIWQWPLGQGGFRRMLLLAMIGLLSGVLAYGLAYRSMVGMGMCMEIDPVTMTKTIYAEPGYIIQSYLPWSMQEYVTVLFQPAHQIDKWWRPQIWARRSSPLTKEEREETLADLTTQEIQELEALIGRPLTDEPSR